MRILLVVYDNDSYIHTFPLGIAYIASALARKGHEVEIYNQDKFHYPEEHLTQYLDKEEFGIVGLGIIGGYYQYKKLLKISGAINKSKKRPFYVLGGHGPSPEPDFFLKKTQADAVVIGEGDETIVELAEAVAGKGALSGIKGIAFREGNKVTVNDRRNTIKNINSLPLPAYDLFPVDYYRLLRGRSLSNNDFIMPVLSARGCPFRCTFCYRMDKGYRPRSNKSIIEEIKFLKEKYHITFVSFADELLMSSAERTRSLCEDLLADELNLKWFCNGRLNYAKPEILKLMKRAGCVFINYGIESMDDTVLKNMKKELTTKQVIGGVEATLTTGIRPGLNIIFGNIGDNKETLRKGVEFLLKYDDCYQMRTIRPVTPYPGSELYYYAIENGLLKNCEDFYHNKHVNSDLVTINFTDMGDDEFHRSLLKANTILLKNYFKKKLSGMLRQTRQLYLKRDSGFRGFRQT